MRGCPSTRTSRGALISVSLSCPGAGRDTYDARRAWRARVRIAGMPHPLVPIATIALTLFVAWLTSLGARTGRAVRLRGAIFDQISSPAPGAISSIREYRSSVHRAPILRHYAL
jgi:hypothetical protein